MLLTNSRCVDVRIGRDESLRRQALPDADTEEQFTPLVIFLDT